MRARGVGGRAARIAVGGWAALLVVALVVPGATAAPRQVPAAPAVLTVSPAPAVRTASPDTQISLRGPLAVTSSVTVTGSRSGRHSGTLRPHSDGRGASFVLARPLRGGETATVRVTNAAAGGQVAAWRFGVGKPIANPAPPIVVPAAGALGPTEAYRTRPDLRPSKVTVATSRPGQADGLIFLSTKDKRDKKQAGPELIDNRGEPLWFAPLPGITAATDFRAQTYQGKPVLTYWEGISRGGRGVGDVVIRDQSYAVIRRIRTANGFRPDLHEFVITPRDTALLLSYPVFGADLHAAGGSRRGQVVDSVVQEIDLATGLVMYEWHSIGAIAYSESLVKPVSPRVPWDYAHVNAVHEDSDGDLLVSLRNTSSILKLDRTTGSILWRLGGTRSSFRMGPGTRFTWQHDPVREADGTLTLFDNSANPPTRKASRAITLRVDEQGKTATLVQALEHPRRLLAASQGSVERLPNGNLFVGWGSQRYFSEFAPDGTLVWDAHLSVNFETYRAYRAPWVGRPRTAPAVLGLRSGSGTRVYASWNGATEVASWQVLAGASATSLVPAGSGARTGFESAVTVAGAPAFVAVRALSASGTVLGTSTAVRVRRG